MNDYATLRGLAVGDALGARFERIDGTRSLELADWRGELLGGGDPRIWPKGRPAGGTTDDTAFALALAGSLIESRGYDRLHAAASYVKLLDEEPPGGLGPTLRTAIERLKAGASPDDSGVVIPDTAPYCGSGTAMRIAPLGLYSARSHGHRPVIEGAEFVFCYEDAMRDATITHQSREAMAGSLVVAIGTRALVYHGFDKARHAIRSALQIAGLEDTRVRRALTGEIAADCSGDVANLVGLAWQDLTLASLDVRPWCNRAEVFRRAMLRTIARGGDTDTRAAVLGAWLGTWLGADAIPPEWAAGVQGWKTLEAYDRALSERDRFLPKVP